MAHPLDVARGMYHRFVPVPMRRRIYRLRNPGHFRELRQIVYPSPRGDFSLRPFDQHRCIFVHIPKTAGISVAQSLFGFLPYHYTARDYRLIYGARTFRRYFKFAFVRNPWDRVFSAYRFLRRGGWNEADRAWMEEHISRFDTFTDFIEGWLTPENALTEIHFRPQGHFVCNRRQHLLLDYVGYMETIEYDYKVISAYLNIDAELERRNDNPVRADYRDYYTDRTRAVVQHVYQHDIDLFGYHFEGIGSRRLTSAQW